MILDDRIVMIKLFTFQIGVLARLLGKLICDV